MRLIALSFALVSVATGCTSDEPRENPQVVSDLGGGCATNERLVTDVCTELGPDDGCVDVDDVCINLCDGLASCTTVSGELRPLTGWPTAPDGYCVECAVP